MLRGLTANANKSFLTLLFLGPSPHLFRWELGNPPRKVFLFLFLLFRALTRSFSRVLLCSTHRDARTPALVWPVALSGDALESRTVRFRIGSVFSLCVSGVQCCSTFARKWPPSPLRGVCLMVALLFRLPLFIFRPRLNPRGSPDSFSFASPILVLLFRFWFWFRCIYITRGLASASTACLPNTTCRCPDV